MAKFAIMDSDSVVDEERFNTIEEAVEKATQMVTDDADTEVEIVQIIKKVSSTLKVDVVDIV
jgi:archaellum component FlaF (FlaF/FlaG flagellin family)